MNVVVYCGSNGGANARFAECARDLGTWIARHGHALVYGGSSVGLMGIVSRAVLDGGGEVYGVEPRFFIEAGVAQHDLTELIEVETMGERKAKMIELGDVFVAIPGGVGTLEEISEIMSRIRLGLGPTECYFLNLDGFYDPLRALLGNMLAQGFVEQSDMERFHFPESLDALTASIAHGRSCPAQRLVTASELISPR
ncbi:MULTISPECIES: TIGR00730 family Rossman fold protein [unclassified Adlercreutzia]|uniref:LOG family protein n=1 Tax=unclassified Adlercreutzia TaxID=2636013 RepID=UPI0013ED9F64|nr:MULTISPECIES: TIGR00730 family Rossman fold protein [unclassified Adlercreutzia]